MAYIEGEGRNQGTLFPVVLDDLVPADHLCRAQWMPFALGSQRSYQILPF